VRGERINRVIAAEAAQRGVTFEEVETGYLQGQSIKRFVEPEEIADLCVFLASPASKMISGQAIGLDGHTETYRMS
jgi:NAD(P)-dependent dehydrogenase (short-subunit alcohol dehydrogenase family)